MGIYVFAFRYLFPIRYMKDPSLEKSIQMKFLTWADCLSLNHYIKTRMSYTCMHVDPLVQEMTLSYIIDFPCRVKDHKYYPFHTEF